LSPIKLLIKATGVEKFLMSPTLHDSPLIEDQNLVGILNG
jgi:hypothetical protein